MATQAQLLTSIERVNRQMMSLLEDLSDEQLAVSYESGINPPIWEVGHSAFFYEYFLLRGLYGISPIQPDLDDMWDSFVIPHKERWSPGVVPDKEATLDYYHRVVSEAQDRLAAPRDLTDEELYLGQYVIAHQCMHLESLIWCRQTAAFQPPSYLGEDALTISDLTRPTENLSIPGGNYLIGVPAQETGQKSTNFSFDNERPSFEVELPPFQIASTLVSQGDYLAFVEDAGYERPELWSFGGNYWLRNQPKKHPVYWRKKEGQWQVRRFDQWNPVEENHPMIHVSYWEAEAYCHWANRRLPTEFEWEAAARGPNGQKYPWPEDDPCAKPADLGCRFLGTAPVTAFPEAASPSGCLQMIGTAWEWTSSQYLPYDGFSVDMYAYMSTLQFGNHKTCRGGSGATSASLIRNTYRQAYFPDRNDVFVGFRTCAM